MTRRGDRDRLGYLPDHTLQPSSLGQVLRRAHVMLALAAVALAGLILAIPVILTIRITAAHDLSLLGRAVGQTLEAAVVFGDHEAAQEALTAIVADDDVAEATVIGRDGTVLARWQDDMPGWRRAAGAFVSWLLREQPVQVPVMHDHAVAGGVTVRGAGRTLARVLALGIAGILLCQALIGVGAVYLSRRLVQRIVRPLQALADLTGAVQRERAFRRRVPTAGISELNDLGTSFNGLLAELESWQTLMEGENERLLHQARHDGLTGLANRAHFEGQLHRALADSAQVAAQGNASHKVAVLLIDCDRFKMINDQFGHAAGDAVLIAVANRLRGLCREHDVVARLGGDEFAILVVPSPDLAGLAGLLAAIAQAMRAPVEVRGELAVTASLSIGTALAPDDGRDGPTLLQRADEVMYAAKRTRADEPRTEARRDTASSSNPTGERSGALRPT